MKWVLWCSPAPAPQLRSTGQHGRTACRRGALSPGLPLHSQQSPFIHLARPWRPCQARRAPEQRSFQQLSPAVGCQPHRGAMKRVLEAFSGRKSSTKKREERRARLDENAADSPALGPKRLLTPGGSLPRGRQASALADVNASVSREVVAAAAADRRKATSWLHFFRPIYTTGSQVACLKRSSCAVVAHACSRGRSTLTTARRRAARGCSARAACAAARRFLALPPPRHAPRHASPPAWGRKAWRAQLQRPGLPATPPATPPPRRTTSASCCACGRATSARRAWLAAAAPACSRWAPLACASPPIQTHTSFLSITLRATAPARTPSSGVGAGSWAHLHGFQAVGCWSSPQRGRQLAHASFDASRCCISCAAFRPHASANPIAAVAGKPIVENCLAGYNGCIFACKWHAQRAQHAGSQAEAVQCSVNAGRQVPHCFHISFPTISSYLMQMARQAAARLTRC